MVLKQADCEATELECGFKPTCLIRYHEQTKNSCPWRQVILARRLDQATETSQAN